MSEGIILPVVVVESGLAKTLAQINALGTAAATATAQTEQLIKVIDKSAAKATSRANLEARENKYDFQLRKQIALNEQLEKVETRATLSALANQKIKTARILAEYDALVKVGRELATAEARLGALRGEKAKDLELTRQMITAQQKLNRVTAELKALKTPEGRSQAKDLAEKQALISATKQQIALEAELKQAQRTGGKTAEQRLILQLTERHNRLLAERSEEVKRLRKEIDALTAAEHRESSGARRLNLARSAGNQITAASRAAVQGLGASFGIYTSATIAAAAASYAFFAGLKATLKSGVDFEAHLTRVGALISTAGAGTQQYSEDLQALKNTAIGIASSTRFMASEVMDAMEQLGLAGFTVDETISGVNDVLALAAIGAMDFGEAAEIASNVLMGFGMNITELGYVVDVLSRGATESNANVQELGHAMSYAAPVAKSFGVSLEFTTAMMEALANAGIKGSRAGTGIRRMLIGLFTPNERAQKVMKSFGITVGEVAQNMEELESLERPVANMFKGAQYGTEALIKKLKEFYVATNGATQNLQLLRESVGVYALPAFTQLITSLNLGEKSLFALAEGLDTVAGSAQDTLSKMQDNLKTTLLIFKSAAETTALKIFDSESAGLKELAEDAVSFMKTISLSDSTIRAFVSDLKRMATTIGQLIVLLISFKAALLGIGIFTQVIHPLARGLLNTIDAFKMARMEAAKTAAAVGMVGAAANGAKLSGFVASLWGLAKALIPITLAVGAVTAAIALLIGGLDGLKKAWSAVFGGLDAFKAEREALRIKQEAEYNELISGGLEALYKRRDELEKEMRTQGAITEELKKQKEEHADINRKLAEKNTFLRNYADTTLYERAKEAREEIQKLERKMLAFDPYPERHLPASSRALPSTGKFGIKILGAAQEDWAQAFQQRSVTPDMSGAVEIAELLAVEKAKLSSTESLRKILKASSDIDRRLELTGGYAKTLASREKLQATLDTLIAQRTRLEAQDKKDTKAIGELTRKITLYDSKIQELTEHLRDLEEVVPGYIRPSTVPFEEQMAIYREATAAFKATLAEQALPEAEQAAIKVKRLGEAYATAKEKVNALMTEVEDLYRLWAATEDPAKKAELEFKISAARADVLGEQERILTLDKEFRDAQKDAGKGANDLAKGYDTLAKSAYELAEAERQLAQTQLEQRAAWLDVNERLMARTDLYASVTAKAREYVKTLREERYQASEPIGGGTSAPTHGGAALIPTTGKLNPVFASSLQNMISDAAKEGITIGISSGYRSYERQAQLFAAAVKKYSSEATARKHVAPPGKSRHNYGLAADLSTTEKGYSWIGRNVEKYGLTRPMSHERWHVEPIGARSVALPNGGSSDPVASITQQAEQMIILKQTKEGVVSVSQEQIAAAAKELDWGTRLNAAIEEQVVAQNDLAQAKARVDYFSKMAQSGRVLDAAQTKAYGQALDDLNRAMSAEAANRDRAIAAEEQLVKKNKLTVFQIKRSEVELEALGQQYGTVRSAVEEFYLHQAKLNTLLEEGRISVGEHNTKLGELRQRLADAQGPIASFYESLRYGANDFKKAFVDAMATLRDSLVDFITTGSLQFKNFFASIKTFIARLLADTLVRQFLSLFSAVSISGSVSGGQGSGEGNKIEGQTTPQLSNAFSALSFSNLTGTSLGKNIAGGIDWLRGVNEATPGVSSFWNKSVANLSATPNWALAGAGLVGGMAGGYLANTWWPGEYTSIGSTLGGVAGGAAGSAIGAGMMTGVWGGPIGMGIGALLGSSAGGKIGSLFGGGDQKTPVGWVDIQQGVFKGVKQQGMTDAQVEGITQALDAVNQSLSGAANLLGPEAQRALAAQSRTAPQALSPDQAGSWLQHEAQKLVGYMADAVPGKLGEEIRSAFDISGGDLEAFLVRVQELQTVFAQLPDIVKSLSEAGLQLGEDAEATVIALMKAAGGLDNLGQAHQALYQVMYSEEERQQKAQKELKEVLDSLNLALPVTREELRQLVSGLDLSSESGRQAYLALAAFSGAIEEVISATDAATQAAIEEAEAKRQAYLENSAALEELVYTETQLARLQATRAAAEANAIGVSLLGIDITKLTQESFGRAILALGGVGEALSSLGDRAGEFIDAARRYYSAMATLRSSGASAGASTSSAASRDPAFAYDAQGRITGYAGSLEYNGWGMAIGVNVGGGQVVPYTKLGEYVPGNVSPTGGGGYYLPPTTYSNANVGPSISPERYESMREAASEVDNFRKALSSWIAKMREGNDVLKDAVALEKARVEYAYQLAAARSGTRDADSLLAAADKYIELAKLQAHSRIEYERVLNRTIGEVQALLPRAKQGKAKSTGFLPVPSFSGGGIATGPSTGHLAMLHGDEAVIPLENGNVPVRISYADLIAEIKALRYDVNAANIKTLSYSKKTADALDKWDKDGQPPERT